VYEFENYLVFFLCAATDIFFVAYVRYFTGNTTNPDGTSQFTKGKTSVKAALNGAVKILTVAVCIH